MSSRREDDDPNSFKILLATDSHLGYCEKDPNRGNDSLVSFEEVLELGRKKNVDFVLLGGDLFHENKPSRRIMHGSIALFRKYCMGDKPIQFEFLSDQSVNFEHCQFPMLNYEDPNLNISMPVFSIHGNHDDPTGDGNLCSLDILHSSGLVNYFGKTMSLDKLQLSPLLLQKGTTKLAIYGLGSVRDERLHRMFLHKNVTMLRPKENQNDWFNMFVIHQNRSKHSATNYIPEQFLDDFLDLIFWGHEHECRIDPEWNGTQNFYVTQPGSSIATSLSEGETVKKYAGLLHVRGKDFKLTKIPLETVRPFYMTNIVLEETSIDPEDPDVMTKVEAFCVEKVEALLDQAEREHTGNPKQPTKPLIRLRIEYTGFEPFSTHRFGQKFVNRVANPRDLVLFQRKKKVTGLKKEGSDADTEMLAKIRPQSLDSARVEDLVREYFASVKSDKQLQVLTEKGLGEAVKQYVDKDEKEAISELVKHQLSKTREYLKSRNANEENLKDKLNQFKETRKTNEEDEDVKEVMKKIHSQPRNDATCDSDNELSDSSDTSGREKSRVSKGQRKGQGRGGGDTGGRGSRGGKGSRGKKQPVVAGRGTRSIRDSFMSSGKTSSSRSSRNQNEDNGIIDDLSDDDDLFGVDSSSNNTKQKHKKDVVQKQNDIVILDDDDDDDDDDELYPVRKRRR